MFTAAEIAAAYVLDTRPRIVMAPSTLVGWSRDPQRSHREWRVYTSKLAQRMARSSTQLLLFTEDD